MSPLAPPFGDLEAHFSLAIEDLAHLDLMLFQFLIGSLSLFCTINSYQSHASHKHDSSNDNKSNSSLHPYLPISGELCLAAFAYLELSEVVELGPMKLAKVLAAAVFMPRDPAWVIPAAFTESSQPTARLLAIVHSVVQVSNADVEMILSLGRLVLRPCAPDFTLALLGAARPRNHRSVLMLIVVDCHARVHLLNVLTRVVLVGINPELFFLQA